MTDATIPRGQWVRIHRVVLEPSERAEGLPADTAALPFESWTNGWLREPAAVGGEASIETPAGRTVVGTVVAVNPAHEHTFGPPPTPLQEAGKRATDRMRSR
jgi:2-amino-4-ketopentanoate thiolase alpha subunit